MELVSQCALRVKDLIWRPGHGGFAFTAVCKATFELRIGLSPLAAEQDPVIVADVPSDSGALVLATDLVPFKKRPEVLVTGHAHAPDGVPVPSLTARLAIGEIDKALQITGDRYFGLDGKLSDPARFTRMPLVWERAAGGPDTSNPAGRPLGDAARGDFFGRVHAPNFLPPGGSLTSRNDIVSPINFGPLAPRWPSRAACLHHHAAGWDPARWHERPLPADIDLAYFNAAPADQQRTTPFGDDQLYLENLHPRFPRLQTRLAPVSPAATVDMGSGPQPLQLRCDTLLIDTDRGLAMLVWRAHVLLDRPDRPGRVVVTDPAAPLAPRGAPTVAIPDIDTTFAPGAITLPASILPFTDAAAVSPSAFPPPPSAPIAPSPAVLRQTPPVEAEDAPGFLRAMTVALPDQGPSPESAPALPFRPSAPPPPPAFEPAAFALPAFHLASPAPSFEPPPPPPSFDSPAPTPSFDSPAPSLPLESPAPPASGEPPAPPALLGPVSPPPPEPPADTPPAGAAPSTKPEPDPPFEDYPPARCAAIAARLACIDPPAGEEQPTIEDQAAAILRAEDLDLSRWPRIHRHWLDRIDGDLARGRSALLAEYDAAYVATLETLRGPLTPPEYAHLADAAERDDESAALTAHHLPDEAWPHIHRVWIQRMVKDLSLTRQVHAALEALRAGD